jgi:hypothetical protein
MRATLCAIALTLVLAVSAYATQNERQQQPQTSQQSEQSSPAEKPRIFITDSQSWEMRGAAGGANGAFAAEMHGGARPQTAEIIKTFGERCPEVTINNQQAKANYIVLLDHEGGKGYLRYRNKVAVFDARSGDSVVSKSTLSLGGSVEDACKGIMQHWATHKTASQTDPPPQAQVPAGGSLALVPATSAGSLTTVSISSVPASADVEVDGKFVGNTPSSAMLSAGEHTMRITRRGYKAWERKLTVSGGSTTIHAELEEEK